MADTRKLQQYIARNGDVIPGANGETGTLPGPIDMGNFWNNILPNPENPTETYVPNLPAIKGDIADRWMKLTRRYNDLVSEYQKADTESATKKGARKAFLEDKKNKIKSKMSSVRNQLTSLAYFHNNTILEQRAKQR